MLGQSKACLKQNRQKPMQIKRRLELVSPQQPQQQQQQKQNIQTPQSLNLNQNLPKQKREHQLEQKAQKAQKEKLDKSNTTDVHSRPRSTQIQTHESLDSDLDAILKNDECSKAIDGPIHQCVYVEWYRFRKCTIKTCKNFTEATKTKCLAIDRRPPEGTKIISDEELKLFKFYGDNISTRLVSIRRKKAQQRVEAILALYKLISYIKEMADSKSHELIFTRPDLLAIEKKYPLRIKKLGFKNWMWDYILDEDTLSRFYTTITSDVTISQMLDVTDEEFKKLACWNGKVEVEGTGEDEG